MTIRHPEAVVADDRGSITDLLQDVPLQHATLIRSVAGAVRGGHYHRLTTQYVYVLSGRLRAAARVPGGRRQETEIGPGDLIVNEPLERHELTALEDACFLVLAHGPRGGDQYASDTYAEAV